MNGKVLELIESESLSVDFQFNNGIHTGSVKLNVEWY